MAVSAQKRYVLKSMLLRQLKHVYSIKEQSTWYRIADIVKKAPKENEAITVKGWIKATRKMKDFIFIDVSDGSCANKLQIMIPKTLKKHTLTFGSSVEAEGILSINKNNNQIELKADSMKVVGACDPSTDYPFAARKSYPEDYIRQHLHFRPRHTTFAALLRLRDAASRGLHDVLHERGFVWVHTPILTSNDCEGAGEVFLVTPNNKLTQQKSKSKESHGEESYFNSKAFLTVSGQLHLEAAVRGLSQVYTFGPTFRAENSRSRLHLSEFYMLEAELAFSTHLEDAMRLAELLVKGSALRLLEKHSEDLAALGKMLDNNVVENVDKLIKGTFPRLKYLEAVDILQAHASSLNVPAPKPGETLTKEHELFLCNHLGQEGKGAMLFVTEWPVESKPFYMARNKERSDKTDAFDMLGPISGELCGGSVREPCADVLKDRLLNTAGPDALKSLEWYLSIRRHGNVPTSGFGLGFERFLQCLLGISNIKDTLPFPRWPHNLHM